MNLEAEGGGRKIGVLKKTGEERDKRKKTGEIGRRRSEEAEITPGEEE